MATETDPNNVVTEGQEQTAPQRTPEVQAEIDRLAALGRNGDAPPAPHRPQDDGKPQRPETVPEKFWDAEKGAVNQDALLKSYLELEKARGTETPEQKATREKAEADGVETPEAKAAREKAEAEAGETPEQKAEREKAEAEAATPEVATAVAAAQEDYAKNGGELSAEAREALIKAGIPAEAIDMHIQGVKAQEKAIEATAREAAGGLDVQELLGWAGENLEEDAIKLLNTGLANPKTLADTVRDLAGRYRSANPTEGRLTNLSSTSNYGDVYTSKEQFIADLAAADKSGDNNARAAAVQKLSRSRKAGTVKEVTPRSGPFRR